eukprot:COSAG01_NODE_7600_length_3132_cov_1.387076_4_plen_291_part_01
MCVTFCEECENSILIQQARKAQGAVGRPRPVPGCSWLGRRQESALCRKHAAKALTLPRPRQEMPEAFTTGVGDEQARMRSFIIGVCGLPARVCSLLEFHEFDCASLRMACEEDLKDCGLAKGPRKKIVVLAAQHIAEEVVESPFCPGSFSAPSPSSLLTAPHSEQISVPPSPSKNLPLSIPDDLCLRGHHLGGGPSLPKPSDTAVPTPDQDQLQDLLDHNHGRHKARQQRLQERADAFQALIESEKKEQETARAAAQAAMLEEQQKQEAEAAALARASWRQARRDATRTAA